MSWDIEVHEKVYQRLANEIFFRILRGEYALGAKLPSYIDFAKEAGSSPETVRKAIRELQQQGVVEKTRQGYFVTSDEATVTAFRERYLASVEKEYQNARGKVETLKHNIQSAPPNGEKKKPLRGRCFRALISQFYPDGGFETQFKAAVLYALI